MTSSPKTPDNTIPAFELGVMAGLVAGLGSWALFGTKEGKEFSKWLSNTTKMLQEEIDDYKATVRSQTYQDLVDLVDTLTEDPTPTRPSHFYQNLPTTLPSVFQKAKKTLFAPAESTVTTPAKPKKASKRYFAKTKRS